MKLCLVTNEHRLIRYESYTGRFFGTLKDKYDYSDPLQWVAAGTHVATGAFGLDPLVRDIARKIDKDGNPVKPLEGAAPRLKEDTIDAGRNLAHGKFVTALSQVWNIAGDGLADFADRITDVSRNATRRQVSHLMSQKPLPKHYLN